MIEACARHDVRGISPWRDKLAELGVDEAARLIRQHELTVTGLCRGGMFPAPDAAGRRAALDDNRRAVDDAATLGAQCLVLVVGGIVPGTKDLAGRKADGPGRHRRVARVCARLQGAAGDRAAASDVLRRPRVRQHDRPGAGHLRCGRAAGARRSALGRDRRGGRRLPRLVGPEPCARRSRGSAASGCSAITSATGWCPPRTCCSTAA